MHIYSCIFMHYMNVSRETMVSCLACFTVVFKNFLENGVRKQFFTRFLNDFHLRFLNDFYQEFK